MSKEQDSFDVVILGAGTAGLSAVQEIRKTTQNFLLVNQGPLGTTCARVGCMPSKALIQVANDFSRRKFLSKEGILGAEHLKTDIPRVLSYVRELRDRFVKSVLDDLKNFEDRIVSGFGKFKEPNVLVVGDRLIRTKKTIIATGSSPVIPEKWKKFSTKLITSDQLFELDNLPSTLAVVGLGVVGMEIGQALSRLGVRVTGFDQGHSLGILTDPVLLEYANSLFQREFEMHLDREVELQFNKDETRIIVSSGGRTFEVEQVFASLGRKPNLDGLDLEKIGLKLDSKGIPAFNLDTMQVEDAPIFIAGDVNKKAPVLHEAAYQGRAAGYNSGREALKKFESMVPLAITFTEPNLARVGMSYTQLKDRSFIVGEDEFNYGRSILLSADGKVRVYADSETKEILGAEIVGPSGEHLAHFLAILIHQGMTFNDALKLPYYHPVVEETLRGALKDLVKK